MSEENLKAADQATILLVDDEELLREVLQMMVEDFGVKALVAEHAEEALQILQEKIGEIDVLLTDFSMPGMNGFELIQKAFALKPTIGAIIASGLKVCAEAEELVKTGKIQFIGKPFSANELRNALKTKVALG